MSLSEIMKFDGTTLVAFCAVAEELNFARAAARLCMSQPPLSRRIRRLEDVLGTPLFLRTTRSVKLTPAGALLYEHAQKICGDLDYMLVTVRELVRGESGTLSIAITPTAANSPLVGALHAFRSAHTGVALELHEMDSIKIWDELLLGKLDVALMRPVGTHDSIEMTVVYDEPLGLVTRREQAYTGGRTTLAQVIRHPLVGYNRNLSPYLHELSRRLLAQASSDARIVQESRLPSILTLVEAGVGSAIVPRSIVGGRSDVLKFHTIESASVPQAQIVVARPRRGTNPIALSLIGTLLLKQEHFG